MVGNEWTTANCFSISEGPKLDGEFRNKYRDSIYIKLKNIQTKQYNVEGHIYMMKLQGILYTKFRTVLSWGDMGV